MWYYATEGSNGKDDVDTEGGIQEDGFDTEGGGERMVQKVVSYIALLPNDIRTGYLRHETAGRGFR